MVTLIFLRHGYSKCNKEHRFCGQYDSPLDEIGHIQAQHVKKYITENIRIDKIYSSDLSRAVDTVKPTALALGLPIETRTDLREVDVGTWQTRLVEDVKKEDAEAYNFYQTDPGIAVLGGGESHEMLMQRALLAVDEIVAENDGKTVLIATHGGLIRTLQCAWSGCRISRFHEFITPPNASLTVVKYENGKAEFLQTGFNGHLTEL